MESVVMPWRRHAYKSHDDVIKWKHIPRYWPFVRGIHRSPVNSPHKGQWRGALMFSLICARINGWANNGDAGDLRRHLAHYDVIVMTSAIWTDVLIIQRVCLDLPRKGLIWFYMFETIWPKFNQILKFPFAVESSLRYTGEWTAFIH